MPNSDKNQIPNDQHLQVIPGLQVLTHANPRVESCSSAQGVRDKWWDLAMVTSERLGGQYSLVKKEFCLGFSNCASFKTLGWLYNHRQLVLANNLAVNLWSSTQKIGSQIIEIS